MANVATWVNSSRIHAASSADRIMHLAGWPPTSRYDWARDLLADVAVIVKPIPAAAYPRPSRVPSRAILDVGRATRLGIPPGTWRSGSRT